MGKIYNTSVARITPNGISFNMLKYTCRRAIREQWFDCPFHIGRTLPIWYHSNDSSTIIIGHNENEDICRLVTIAPYEGKHLVGYHEALDCLKMARKTGYRSRFREKRL